MADMNLAPNTSEVAQMSALRIKYDCGLGENGRTIVKTRSFSNVNPEFCESLHVAQISCRQRPLGRLVSRYSNDVVRCSNKIRKGY
ncbi:DUF1659 domain-containing protein [Paraclostridium bifermentans]|uniref:DUF1659 domain-containing protein n=1 Tax=Paraclostridium bifermentans TaxID=1490 RepID=A0A5P3X8G1_PARBF|nr:DUF1659 domain-containing protein [Paraclostridium bifermentans]QEZ67496.1 DUF1659 domain-containing protein [Paraclostridium bifermentans]